MPSPYSVRAFPVSIPAVIMVTRRLSGLGGAGVGGEFASSCVNWAGAGRLPPEAALCSDRWGRSLVRTAGPLGPPKGSYQHLLISLPIFGQPLKCAVFPMWHRRYQRCPVKESGLQAVPNSFRAPDTSAGLALWSSALGKGRGEC